MSHESPEAPSQEQGEYCVWVYAFTDRAGGADLSWLTGMGGARVRGAAAAGLTVLVSHVDSAEFGAEALRANMENLAWLEQAARAHHGVIEAAAGLFPVLPARFATVYTSDATMAAALADHGEELRAALRRVGGCVEWGVKAYAAAAPADARTDDGTAAANGASSGTGASGMAAAGSAAGAGGTGAGTAYLKRRRAELSARENSRRALAASAQAVHTELSGRAARARLYPPQSPALSGSRSPMLLNAAYLLEPANSPGFASAVAEAAIAHPDLRLDLSGPWPPYSFTAQAS